MFLHVTSVEYLEDGRVKYHSKNIEDGKTEYTIFNNAVEKRCRYREGRPKKVFNALSEL